MAICERSAEMQNAGESHKADFAINRFFCTATPERRIDE